jgi:hypothetical protein
VTPMSDTPNMPLGWTERVGPSVSATRMTIDELRAELADCERAASTLRWAVAVSPEADERRRARLAVAERQVAELRAELERRTA